MCTLADLYKYACACVHLKTSASTARSSVTVTHFVLSHLISFHGSWSQLLCDQRRLHLHYRKLNTPLFTTVTPACRSYPLQNVYSRIFKLLRFFFPVPEILWYTDTLTCNQMFKMTIYHFLSLYPMIFEYWARICRRYQSVGPILADTDILNPRILMHEARKADNPHGCTVFSGFFEPFLYPKTGVSYIWPGGVRISLPNAPIWPQWTALENVMKCDERHMFGLSFTAFIYCIMSIRTFSLILHVLFLTI